MSEALFNKLKSGEITRAEYDKQHLELLKEAKKRIENGKGTAVTDVDQFLRTL